MEHFWRGFMKGLLRIGEVLFYLISVSIMVGGALLVVHGCGVIMSGSRP